MRSNIRRVHGERRQTGGRQGATTLSLSTLGGIITLALGVLVMPLATAAQQPATTVHRIGFLAAGSSSVDPARHEAFRQGLRELGYVEGKNIVIERRFTEGNADRLPGLAAELVRLKVDVIVTGGGQSTRAAKAATVTIPIVMLQDNDPVGNGFVASLARPSGNITGLATLAPEISGKRLELLKQIVPRLSRVAVLGTSTNPGNAQLLKEIELTAGAFKVQLQYLDVLDPKDIETAFRAASQSRADAVLVLVSSVLNANRKQVIDLAAQSRLPTIYWERVFAEAGGLMTYGVSYIDLHRRAAVYVDKLLKGATPADLPVEQPMKFELLINLKTAQALGLTMPPTLLFQADEVIR